VLSSLFVRLRALVFRRAADAELDEELRYHLERETDRNIARGMSPAVAHDTARRSLGNLSVAREAARDAMRWRWLEELRQDVAYAVRVFRRAPMFVLAVVATIGLGLGLLASAFTFFDAYVLRPLAVRDPYALYEMGYSARSTEKHQLTWRQYQRLETATAQGTMPFTETFGFAVQGIRMNGRAALGQLVTGNYFQMLDVPPALGRTLLPSDASESGTGAAMVLSHRAWQSIFGGDSSVVGRRVSVNGASLTIVGVAREGFGGLSSVPFDFWIPITMISVLGPVTDLFGAREPEGVRVIGRLRHGATQAGAAARLLAWLARETADRPPLDRADGVTLISRGTSMPRSPDIMTIFGPVVAAFLLVLLIACANVANMMLARGMARQREIGIRLALGAGRGRLIRQLLTEAVLLALPSGVLGILVSRATIAASLGVMYSTVPRVYIDYLRVVPLELDGRIFVFMLTSALVAGIAFGLAPALQATRPNIVQASRGDFDTQFRPSRLRGALVVAQITLSVLLVVSAGILLSTARHSEQLEPGIRTRNVVQIALSPAAKPGVIDALRRDPLVRAIATSSTTPLDGRFAGTMLASDGRRAEPTSFMVVSPDYFTVFDLPILSGRRFSDEEARARAGVVIVSRSTARHFWPRGNAIGQTLMIPTTDPDYVRLPTYHTAHVIGVTGDAVPGWIGGSASDPVVYYPRPLDDAATMLLVRVGIESDQARPRLERIAASVDSSAVREMHSLEESLAVQIYPFKAMYWVASALGVIALLLTVTGVYGVLAYVVAQRKREFGIRMALGAGVASVINLVLRESVRLALVGSTAGLVLAFGASRLLRMAFWRLVSDIDVVGFVGGPALVIAACVVAAYIPSRRAAKANPVDVLRADS
jgi:predicted permease